MRAYDDATHFAGYLLQEFGLAGEHDDEFVSGRMGFPTFPVTLCLVETNESPRIALRAEGRLVFDVVLTEIEDGECLGGRAQMYGVLEQVEDVHASEATRLRARRLERMSARRIECFMAKPATIDAYLARLPDDQRIALEKVRRAIAAAAPSATECFGYGLPAFRDAQGLLAGFGASKKHCSYHPMSGSVVEALASELEHYDTSKGTIRFDAARPLSAALVRKLVKARQAEIAAPAAKAPVKKKVSGKPAKTPAAQTDAAVAAYMLALKHPLKRELEAVRRIILSVSPETSEGIKWKVPSFRTSKDFFATLHPRSTESVQVILHLGAKVRADQGLMTLADPQHLMKWLGPNRCLITLGKGPDVSKHRAAFAAIVRAWIEFV
jgi:uncharacterized protein YdhG (YjbR/CyaY superfamily)